MEESRKLIMSWSELGLSNATRVMCGAGLALLLADRLAPEQRKGIGWTLFSIGTLIGIPLTFQILSEQRSLLGEVVPRPSVRPAA